MDYKNFILRVPATILLLLAFNILVIQNDQYIRVLIYPIYLIILIEIFIYFRINLFIFAISIIYLIISFICIELYLDNYYNKKEFIFLILLVIVFDISSYILGSKFGNLKILPTISPKKTLVGLISGLIISMIFGYLFNLYYKLFDYNLVILFIFFTIFFSFIGDIFESILKRKSRIKNSSEVLLGHGGFFDRFDSLIMVVIWLFFFNVITN